MIKNSMNNMPRILFCLISTFAFQVHAEPTPTAHSQDGKNVVALVNKAKEYIESHGKVEAMKEFNKKVGLFSKDSSYVFAVAYDGTYLATINYPNLVGVNQFSLKDPHRTFLVKEEINKAKLGGGWLKPRLKKNPHTGKHECKASYVIAMEGDYLIGSGYYYQPDRAGKC
ncbi:MAG: cache domain-containing protein [Proteobacteria bacterium]|nr:cache domain-containing protein [Pseudomonadota bacterium]